MISIAALYIITLILDREAVTKAKLFLCLCPGIAGACVNYTANTSGLSLMVQLLTWTIFIFSIPCAITTKQYYMERTPFLSLALLASYNLLSLSYEVMICYDAILSPRDNTCMNLEVNKAFDA